eukprot:5505490-Prymnesium_polylepis.1
MDGGQYQQPRTSLDCLELAYNLLKNFRGAPPRTPSGAPPRTPPLPRRLFWGSAPDPSENHSRDVLWDPGRARSRRATHATCTRQKSAAQTVRCRLH